MIADGQSLRLQDDELELVVVNMPNPLYYEMKRRALEAGKHVVLEKPFTVTSEEGRALTKLAREQKLILWLWQLLRASAGGVGG